MARTPRMDAFTTAYVETALWSSNDESDDQGGEPLDENYSVSDIDEATLAKMIADCADFQERFGELIDDDDSPDIQKHGARELAGYDFWMTRNGHGVGFWEHSDWPKHGKELDAGAKTYGSFDLYLGDPDEDGERVIYGTPLERTVRERQGVRAPRGAPAESGRWTIEAGRLIYFDGQPCLYIEREGDTRPVVADGAARLIVEVFNQDGVTLDNIYERHMSPRRR